MMVDLYVEGKFPFDKLCDFYTFNEINKAVLDRQMCKSYFEALDCKGGS